MKRLVLTVVLCLATLVAASAQSEDCQSFTLEFEPNQTSLTADHQAQLISKIQNCHAVGETTWRFKATSLEGKIEDGKIAGARLFNLRFFVVERAVHPRQLDLLRTTVFTPLANNKIHVDIENPLTDLCDIAKRILIDERLASEADCGPEAFQPRFPRPQEQPATTAELFGGDIPIPNARGADTPEHPEGYAEEKFFLDSAVAFRDFLNGKPGAAPENSNHLCAAGLTFDLREDWLAQDGVTLIGAFMRQCYTSLHDLVRFEFKSDTPVPLSTQIIWQEWVKDQIDLAADDITIGWGVSFEITDSDQDPILKVRIRSPEVSR